ncbi:unnamed protein product [Triticum turgidum subsp. durum]|uniref:Uncharacterized protein n=1 Tax=Triticum turgidum subsp. durum TaxID=4567 RepID=A0A9R1PAJ9_TRITD|nr:unnamed protein product [Triticum turgidum subsp. durum]
MITLACVLTAQHPSLSGDTSSHTLSLRVAFFYTSLYLIAIMLGALVVFFLGTPTYRFYAPTPGAENPFALLARSLAALAQHDNATSSSLLGNKKEYQVEQKEDAVKKEEARGIVRLLSIWAACLAYGVVFAQFMTLFNKQSRTLDRRIFGSLELPPAALQMLGPATTLLFVPIYDCVLVPMLRHATGTPSGLTLLQRVGTGMTLTLATMLVAALVETRRLETAREHGLVDNIDATVPMCWAWLVPQYVLIGVAGVFAEVGMQEFFYDQMPGELRSLGMSLYYSVIGMGNFISGALISLIDRITSRGGGDSWFADNLNRGHLDYFY